MREANLFISVHRGCVCADMHMYMQVGAGMFGVREGRVLKNIGNCLLRIFFSLLLSSISIFGFSARRPLMDCISLVSFFPLLAPLKVFQFQIATM